MLRNYFTDLFSFFSILPCFFYGLFSTLFWSNKFTFISIVILLILSFVYNIPQISHDNYFLYYLGSSLEEYFLLQAVRV